MPSLTAQPLELNDLLAQLAKLPHDWHGAGVLDGAALAALGRQASRLKPRCTLDTGSGITTLLLSHLAERHLVFSIDGGGSLTRARTSPLLRGEVVEFIEGPTQRTLSNYAFTETVQLAFIDGPHAFPYPDLEYWRIYPQLATGGVLAVDDIQIPSIRLLFNILREDPMFSLLEVVSKTAFFERTSAPTFDPYADGWWEQPYNIRRLDNETGPGPSAAIDLDDAVSTYRERLLPLIAAWRQWNWRVAIFGIGPHTDFLLRAVPELTSLNLVAYLDSTARPGSEYRGLRLERPEWTSGRVDMVLCSSFAYEWRQLEVFDRLPVKTVLSHAPARATS
jgi:hypothetical protein